MDKGIGKHQYSRCYEQYSADNGDYSGPAPEPSDNWERSSQRKTDSDKGQPQSQRIDSEQVDPLPRRL